MVGVGPVPGGADPGTAAAVMPDTATPGGYGSAMTDIAEPSVSALAQNIVIAAVGLGARTQAGPVNPADVNVYLDAERVTGVQWLRATRRVDGRVRVEFVAIPGKSNIIELLRRAMAGGFDHRWTVQVVHEFCTDPPVDSGDVLVDVTARRVVFGDAGPWTFESDPS